MVNIRNSESLFQPLRTRMDDDLNLHFLSQYIMYGRDGRAMEQVSNITLNDPQVFGNAYLSIMGADKRTVEITDTDPTYQRQIEASFNKWIYNNDECLSDQMIEPLDFCLDFYAGFRGWIGVLPLMYQDGNKYMPSILPIDPRWMLWESGTRGLKWASYRIRMDKAQAEATYKKKLNTTDKDVNIECIWDDKSYQVSWINASTTTSGNGEILATIPHDIGFCPVVVVPVPMLPMLINSSINNSDSLAKQGESIFAPVRDLIPKMNEVATVWATINRQQFMTPLAYTGNRNLKSESIFGFGVVVQLEPDEKIDPIPTRDMSPSAQALFSQLFARWERATLSSVNYGQAGDRQSALAIADLKTDRDKVILPRRKAKSKAYRSIFKSLVRQIKSGKTYKTDIEDGDAIDIDKSLFEDKFTVNVTFDSISPQENISNMQLAIQQVRDLGLPRSHVYRNTLRVDDPEGLIRQGKIERMYAMYPEIEMLDCAIELAPGDVTEDSINQLKAQLIVKRVKEALQQQSAPAEVPNAASQPAMNVGPAGSQKKASMMAQQTGQQSMQTAMQSKNMGVENE